MSINAIQTQILEMQVAMNGAKKKLRELNAKSNKNRVEMELAKVLRAQIPVYAAFLKKFNNLGKSPVNSNNTRNRNSNNKRNNKPKNVSPV